MYSLFYRFLRVLKVIWGAMIGSCPEDEPLGGIQWLHTAFYPPSFINAYQLLGSKYLLSTQ